MKNSWIRPGFPEFCAQDPVITKVNGSLRFGISIAESDRAALEANRVILEKVMTINRIKLFTIILFAMAVSATGVMRSAPLTVSAATPEDPAVTFKAKCAMCHTAKAEKFFDPAKPEADLVTAILKGKKGEKPPFMPAFEAKGITEDDAKALVTYMKGLRAPAN